MKRCSSFAGLLRRLHRDQRGAEGLEKLLIIAAIVLPLLGVIIYFAGDIKEWMNDEFEEIKNEDI